LGQVVAVASSDVVLARIAKEVGLVIDQASQSEFVDRLDSFQEAFKDQAILWATALNPYPSQNQRRQRFEATPESRLVSLFKGALARIG
jgi:hypothetical protein